MGKNVLITGAASGIGRAAYESLNKEIFSHFILVDKATIDIKSDNVTSYECDVSSYEKVSSMFEDIRSKNISLDYVLNSAGIPGPNKPFALTSVEEFDHTMNVNFRSTMLIMKEVLPLMEKNGGGRVLNIASVLARCGFAGSSSYSASKAAIVALSRGLAIEYAEKNIQINTLSPGAVDTEFISLLKKRVGVDTVKAIHPVKKVATASEIAQYIKFVFENDTSFMTGTDIPIDGGYSAQ